MPLAALLGALVVTAAPAAELGRLFLSPQQREALERMRHAEASTASPEPPAALAEQPLLAPDDAPLPAADPLRVDGYVSRSGGPPTVWINGTDSYQGNFGALGIDAARVRLERARVRLPVGDAEAGVLLKPGQTFDPYSETVSDAYERPPEAPAIE